MAIFTAQCDTATMICGAVTETPASLTAPAGKTFLELAAADITEAIATALNKHWTGTAWEIVLES